MSDESSYINHQIKVDWGKHVRKFWKVYEPADLHRFLTIDLELYTSNDQVDVENDILVFQPHDDFDQKICELLDKGMRFIIDCLWERDSFIFKRLESYQENGIAFISGNRWGIDNWASDNLHFVPMSFWYIEYYRNLGFPIPAFSFKRDSITHDFLMPVKRKRYYKKLFIDLLGENINKGIYSIVWDNITLPGDIPVENDSNYWSWEEDRYYNPMWYESTYYSMVVETYQEYEVFVTEKTFKPIMYGHPFMIYGAQGILKNLQDNGFHTFPELFDERYDDEPDPVARAKLIIEQIKNLDKNIFSTNKRVIDRKIFENFNRFYHKDTVMAGIQKDIRIPIERFIYEK